MSITTAELKGYWLGLLLHMDKNYAQKRFLGDPTAFKDWLKNPDARYVAGEMVNNSYPEYFDMDGVRLQIVVREGQKVLIKKVE
jgi:outer membrane protein assembly factor BamA